MHKCYVWVVLGIEHTFLVLHAPYALPTELQRTKTIREVGGRRGMEERRRREKEEGEDRREQSGGRGTREEGEESSKGEEEVVEKRE